MSYRCLELIAAAQIVSWVIDALSWNAVHASDVAQSLA
jgi:hypothetical protein